MAWITTCRGFCRNPPFSYEQRRTFQGFISQVKNKGLSSVLFVITIKKLSFQCKVHVFANLQKPTNSVLANTKAYMKGILHIVTFQKITFY